MDTLTERETEREDVPRRQDGSIDLNERPAGSWRTASTP